MEDHQAVVAVLIEIAPLLPVVQQDAQHGLPGIIAINDVLTAVRPGLDGLRGPDVIPLRIAALLVSVGNG